MQWVKKYMTVKQYEYVSVNQHGARFKQNGFKRISVARLSCDHTDVNGLVKLILLSDTLDVPVRYDFTGKQEAYIEVVSSEALERTV